MTDLAHQIWDMKYRLKRADGTPVDVTVDDGWNRVALAAAGAERPETRSQWQTAFKGALAGHRFLPAGRILAGAGTGRAVTLFNCFVMGTIPDDLSGIFGHLREAALTMQQGGGIGYDFSTLRPKGAEVQRRRRRRVGAGLVHGRVGLDVPHDHVRGRTARRDDGHARLLPSRHRGLHRGQACAGPAAQFQSLGAGDRRVHGEGRSGTSRGTWSSTARSIRRCRRAGCGTASCARPMTRPSRA